MSAHNAILGSIDADYYHADEITPQPSLSASVAKLLINESPLHAWTAHPKLNPDWKYENEQRFDIGNAAHAALLEGINVVSIVDAPDWRTVAAREQRDHARANGLYPLLAHHMKELLAMFDAVNEQLGQFTGSPNLLADGRPEQTIVWEDNGVWCRSRIDWLHDDATCIDDLKTTARSANPEAWSRAMFGFGADIQAAFYLRGLKHITGIDAQFRFVVVETSPPYALTVMSLAPDVFALANEKVEYAIQTWKQCLKTGEWPGYPIRVCYAHLPGWEEARWLERELREETAA